MKLLIELWRLIVLLVQQGPRLTMMAAYDKAVRIFLRRPAWRFTQILPNVMLGGQPARRVLPHLPRRKITGVINLREEYNYADEIGDLPLRYLHLPTVDNTAPTLEALLVGVKFIAEEVAKGGTVYIHCWEGLGRGPTMIAAYLVSTGLTPSEAWSRIRRVRPFIRPVAEQITQIDRFAVLHRRAAYDADNTQQTPVTDRMS